MKISTIRTSFTMLIFFAFSAAPLWAQNATYANLSVTGTADFQGASTTFGDWSEGGSAAGLTLNYTDGTTTAINFIGSGTSTMWQWWNYNGTQDLPVLKLDQNNQLILYITGTSGAAGITLNPWSTGTSTFAGSVTISGTDNELPNQILVSGSSILTVELADARYVSSASFVVGTGTASGYHSGAIGNGALASGSVSMSMGYDTTAGGNYAAAFGNNTTAQGYDQFVIGQYNAPSGIATTSSSTNAIFVIGNGTNSGPLSNALVVQQNGNVGLGTSTPAQQLDMTGNLQIATSSTNGGVIYQNGSLFIHSFGTSNFFAGANAGNLTLTGSQNTAVGCQALKINTTGGANTAVGFLSLNSDTTGGENNAFGTDSLLFNTTGIRNTAFGSSALLENTTGWDNQAIGYQALSHNSTANSNIGIGTYTLSYSTTGGGNIAIGTYAGTGYTSANQESLTDNYMIFIGYGAARDSSVPNTTSLTNGVAIGENASVSTSNAIILGGTGTYAVNVGIGKTAPAYKLDVVGDINITGNFYRNGVLASGTGAAGSFGSLVIGSGSISSGGIVALGGSSSASGQGALAMGPYAVASGTSSIAFTDGTATGAYSFAGPGAVTVGNYSTSIGYGASTSDETSIAIGINASTGYGGYSTAIGPWANAQSDTSTAIGVYATTQSEEASAFGDGAYANGYGSAAIGVSTNAGEWATAVGFQASANGNYSMASNAYATANGDFSIVSGYNGYTSGSYSVAFGDNSSANADYSTAFGYSSNVSVRRVTT